MIRFRRQKGYEWNPEENFQKWPKSFSFAGENLPNPVFKKTFRWNLKSVNKLGQFGDLFKGNSLKMFTGAATQRAAQRKDLEQRESASRALCVRGRGHYCTIAMVLTFKLTADIAEVKVSIHQRGPIVEVLGHVVQPVGLHPFDPVVAVLDLQRNLDCVVLHVCVPDWRVVVQSQQLRSCWDATEKNIQNIQKSPLHRPESRLWQVAAVYSRARFTLFTFWALFPSLLHRKDSTYSFSITGKRSRNLLQLQEMIQPFHQSRMTHHSFVSRQIALFLSVLAPSLINTIRLERARVLAVLHFQGWISLKY